MTDFNKYLNMKFDEENNNIYYISDESGIRNLWKINLEDKKKVQLTDSKQNIKNYWLEKDDIIIAIDYHGNERNQYYTLSIDNKLKEIVNNPEYFHHYGVYHKSSKNFYITRNHYNSETFELCTIDENYNLNVLKRFEKPVMVLSKIGSSQLLLTMEVDNINKQLLIYKIDEGSVIKVPLLPSRITHFKEVGQEGYAYCLSNWDSGFMNIYEINLDDWSYQRITSFNWDIETVHWSNDFKDAVISLNKNGCSTLHFFNIKEDDMEIIDFRNDGVIHSMKRIKKKELLILFSSVDTPHCIVNYKLEDNYFKVILENGSEVEKLKWRFLSYPSFDGLEIPYFIYETTNDETSPAVINVHGGPESQARPEFNELYYRLNQQGFTVIVPNIRGSLGYGRFYVDLDNQTKRLDAMKDVLALRKHLIKSHDFDKNNISIMGRSYGGFMTLLLIIHYPQLWRAAVDIVGISHMSTFLRNTSPWRQYQRSAEYGFLGKHDKFFEEISPLLRAKDIKTPLMIFHSDHDARVPGTESVQMVDTMRANNQEVQFTVYDNEGHSFMRKENVDDLNQKVIAFLSKEANLE